MATIAKVTNTKSAHAALSYANTKGVDKLKHDTINWLETNGIDTSQITGRAVVSSGTNGIMPDMASTQMKAVRLTFNQDKQANQALRVIQSFDSTELDPANPNDWQTANDLGQKLAQELYPNYQAAIYTHIDGENHTLHNHIIVSKVNLESGKKMRLNRGEAVKQARQANDELAQEMGWHIIEKPKEAVNYSEQAMAQKQGYSWRKTVKNTVDTAMQDPKIDTWEQFTDRLQAHQITPNLRGKNITFVMQTPDGERRIRGNKLGSDYEKEQLINGLERKFEYNQRHKREIERSNQEINRSTKNSKQRERAINASNQADDGKNNVYQQARRINERRKQAVTSFKSAITNRKSKFTTITEQLRETTDRFKQIGNKLRTTIERIKAFIQTRTHKPSKKIDQSTQSKEPIISTTNKPSLEDEMARMRRKMQQINQNIVQEKQEKEQAEQQRKQKEYTRKLKQQQQAKEKAAKEKDETYNFTRGR